LTSLALVLAILAVAVTAFLLGRLWPLQRRASRVRARARARARSPLEALGRLFDDDPDAADAFVAALNDGPETIDAHLALGLALRRRGAWDKASRLHRHLLARPGLSTLQVAQVEFQLALDHRAAGRIERARRLLEALAARRGDVAAAAREALFELEVETGNWETAISLARDGAFDAGGERGSVIAHCLCELAEGAIDRGDLRTARERLDDALRTDRNCVRATLLRADIEAEAGGWTQAAAALEGVLEQDARFVPEILERLTTVHAQLGTALDEERFLERVLQQAPSTPVLERLLALREARLGAEEARAFLCTEVARHPTLRGLSLLLQHWDAGDEAVTEALRTALATPELARIPAYRCDACGAAADRLLWRCADCGAWGTVAPVQGLLGA
jgi:lipopolysaccharide biosynthesis regulator YciM